MLKDLVNVPLFPYQEDGILFAAKFGRAILADDMGLGKTIQAIAWAMLLQKYFHAQKFSSILVFLLLTYWCFFLQIISTSDLSGFPRLLPTLFNLLCKNLSRGITSISLKYFRAISFICSKVNTLGWATPFSLYGE